MITKETLVQIHELLAKDMLKRLQSGSTVVTKEGEVVEVDVTAAELNVIRQFLKDNGIDKALSEADGDDPFARLVEATNADVQSRTTSQGNH